MTPNPPPPPPPPPPGSPGAPAQKTPTLAIVALTLSILGICFVCFGPIGIILGIIALTKTPPSGKGRGLAIAAIAVGAIGFVFSLGIAAAIAIPNYIKFQQQAKQAECKTRLKEVYAAQVQFNGDQGTYATSFEQLGVRFSNNRYTYFGGDGEIVGPDASKYPDQLKATPDVLPELAGGQPLGLSGTCPDCTFTAACAASFDDDPTFDTWSISTSDRSGDDGEVIPAGEPFHEVDDVNE